MSVEGVACCAAAAIFYLIGENCDWNAEYLKSVTPVRRLQDLAELLNAARRVLPLVVSVSGWVGSDHTPIKCEYSDVSGVIVEKTEKQHFLKRNDKGKWEKKPEYIGPSEWKAVPWYLDDGTGLVYVTGACRATGLPLTFGSEVVKKSRHSLNFVMESEEKGLKILGVEKIERVLPLNSYLTVVGEATKCRNGTVLIRRPSTGRLYVTDGTVGDLISTQQSYSSWCKFAAMGLMVAGVCFLATGESEGESFSNGGE